jgi:hypothetical protein
MRLKFPERSTETLNITFPLTPLLIRLNDDVGKLPAGIVVSLPKQYAWSLIRSKLASVVGSFNAVPDLTLDESETDVVFAS